MDNIPVSVGFFNTDLCVLKFKHEVLTVFPSSCNTHVGTVLLVRARAIKPAEMGIYSIFCLAFRWFPLVLLHGASLLRQQCPGLEAGLVEDFKSGKCQGLFLLLSVCLCLVSKFFSVAGEM